MEEIIALLKFAVDNEKNFTEFDPDGVKRVWIESAKEALVAQHSARRTAPMCPDCGKKCTEEWVCPDHGIIP